MSRGFVFGSSTPRNLSHQKVKEKSSVLEALANDIDDDVHDVSLPTTFFLPNVSVLCESVREKYT